MATTFGELAVGEEFTFTSDPLREVCRKLGAGKYEAPRAGIYDAASKAFGASALSDSTPVRRTSKGRK